jgi:hypothetical protein
MKNENEPVLVHLDNVDDDVGRVDTDGSGGTVALLTVYALDVDEELFAVDLSDLALAALVRAADNRDSVLLSDGERAGLVTFSLFLYQLVAPCPRNERDKKASRCASPGAPCSKEPT